MPPLVLFGIPSYGTVSAQWVMARNQLTTPLGAASAEQWVLGGELSIAEKRNDLVRAALAMNAKYLFFIGDDTLPPPHTFIQLYQRMVNNPEVKIATGVYMSRTFPMQPMIWRGWMEGSYYNWHVGEFFEVDWAGCDCMLVDVDVFRKMPEPWFSQDYVFSPGQSAPIALSTEDIYFYEKARRYGFRAWCDSSIQCVHQDRNSGHAFFLPPDWPQAIAGSELKTRDATYLCADLGAGTDSPYTHGTMVRFDIQESVNPDVRCDLHMIPEPDQKYDEVWSRHTLEHFPATHAPGLVREWSRILKVGGWMHLEVPNFEQAIEAILAGPPKATHYNWWQVYGQQVNEFDYHKNGFTKRALGNLLKSAWGMTPIHGADGMGHSDYGVGCFDDIEVTTSGPSGESIVVNARKVRHPSPAVLGPEGENGMNWENALVNMVAAEPETHSNGHGTTALLAATPAQPDDFRNY